MKKELFEKNPILKLTFDFSLMIINYCEQLDTQKKYIISRQLLKSGESYNIALMPIVTTANFDKVSMFHEKDCWALFTWLNKKGVQALNTAKQNAKSKMIAFILDNKLLRLQLVEDPQFARVEENADSRVYGEVLTFPCNSFSPEELKNFETILKSEQKGNR